MTKLNEAEEKSLDLWYGVIDALLKQMRHHQLRIVATVLERDMTLSSASLKVMHRAAKTLAVFTNPSDD